MQLKLLFVFSFLLRGNTARKTIEPRIVGGAPIKIESCPYQSSLQLHERHICGSALISLSHALTSAHCVQFDNGNYTIRAGSSLLNNGGRVLAVRKTKSHPLYRTTSNDYDIAVVFIGGKLKAGPRIRPIQLGGRDDGKVGVSGAVSGWGLMKPDDDRSFSKRLNRVEVVVMSQDWCRNCYGHVITERMLCAGLKDGSKDACKGDSGGPLVANDRLVGIISWGIDCAKPSLPGVYTRVAKVRDFIAKNVGF